MNKIARLSKNLEWFWGVQTNKTTLKPTDPSGHILGSVGWRIRLWNGQEAAVTVKPASSMALA